MIVLRDSLYLEGLLAGASAAVEFHVAYADQSLTTFLPGGRSVSSTGTTAVLLAGPPGSGVARQVKAVTVFNGDASTQVVTIRTNDGAATKIIRSYILLPGSTMDLLRYLDPTTFDAGAITTGTLAAARMPGDLPIIAGLTTTAFGRSLLTQADAAATRATLGTSDAANLTTGTLPDARLSGNVPLMTAGVLPAVSGASLTGLTKAQVGLANVANVDTTDAANISAGTLAAARGGAGAINGILKANGAGVVSAAVAGTDYLAINGSGTALTALNASQLANGTVPVARLPTAITQATTFRAANSVRAEAASTQDAVVLAGRAGGSTSLAVTITPATLTANQIATLPNATGTLSMLELAQTWTAAQTFKPSITVGDATALSAVNVNGLNGGAGGGSFLAARVAGSATVGIGNWSAMIGGAYDATPTILFSGGLRLTEAGTVRATIDGNGNLSLINGVFTTTFNGNALRLVGGASGGVSLEIDGQTGLASAGRWRIGDGIASSNGTLVIYDYKNSAGRVYIDPAGNVGIGTSAAGGKCNVGIATADTTQYYNNQAVSIYQGNTTANNMAALDFRTANGNSAAAIAAQYIAHTAGAASADLIFYTANAGSAASERVRITAAGLVAIGGTPATYATPVALQVLSGAIRVGNAFGMIIGADGGYLGVGAYYNGSGWARVTANQGGAVIRNSGGQFEIWTGAAATAAADTVITGLGRKFYIDGAGNAGLDAGNFVVGTDPGGSERLRVGGDIRTSGDLILAGGDITLDDTTINRVTPGYILITNGATGATAALGVRRNAGHEIGMSVTVANAYLGTSAPDMSIRTNNLDQMSINSTGILNFTGTGRAIQMNGAQVLTNRRTGWTAPGGTATRTGFNTGSATITQVAEALKALIEDLMPTLGHGLIGA